MGQKPEKNILCVCSDEGTLERVSGIIHHEVSSNGVKFMINVEIHNTEPRFFEKEKLGDNEFAIIVLMEGEEINQENHAQIIKSVDGKLERFVKEAFDRIVFSPTII